MVLVTTSLVVCVLIHLLCWNWLPILILILTLILSLILSEWHIEFLSEFILLSLKFRRRAEGIVLRLQETRAYPHRSLRPDEPRPLVLRHLLHGESSPLARQQT